MSMRMRPNHIQQGAGCFKTMTVIILGIIIKYLYIWYILIWMYVKETVYWTYGKSFYFNLFIIYKLSEHFIRNTVVIPSSALRTVMSWILQDKGCKSQLSSQYHTTLIP